MATKLEDPSTRCADDRDHSGPERSLRVVGGDLDDNLKEISKCQAECVGGASGPPPRPPCPPNLSSRISPTLTQSSTLADGAVTNVSTSVEDITDLNGNGSLTKRVIEGDNSSVSPSPSRLLLDYSLKGSLYDGGSSDEEEDDEEDEQLLQALDAELKSQLSKEAAQAEGGDHGVGSSRHGSESSSLSDSPSRVGRGGIDVFASSSDSRVNSSPCASPTVLSRDNALLEELERERKKVGELSKAVAAEREEKERTARSVQALEAKHAAQADQIKGLQKTVADQYGEATRTQETAKKVAANHQKNLSDLKQDQQKTLQQVMKKYNDCKIEKESVVVSFAQSEKKAIQQQRRADTLEQKVKEKDREKEILAERVRALRVETRKLEVALGVKTRDLDSSVKEVETLKEAQTSHEYRVKWAQNKLKSELESHKETKGKFEEMTRKFKEAKEETSIIRKDCQDIVKTYQESEEIKSNSLDLELRRKQNELQLQLQQQQDSEELLDSTNKELDSLKMLHQDLQSEHSGLSTKVRVLEEEQRGAKQTVEELMGTIERLQAEGDELRSTLVDIEKLELELTEEKEKCITLDTKLQEVTANELDLSNEMELCNAREQEMLQLTQRMTEKNAELQSENSSLSANLSACEAREVQLSETVSHLVKAKRESTKELADSQAVHTEDVDTLASKTLEYERKITALTQDLEEARNQNKAAKRKHTSAVKDLTREVQIFKRRLENAPGSTDSARLTSAVPPVAATGGAAASVQRPGVRRQKEASPPGLHTLGKVAKPPSSNRHHASAEPPQLGAVSADSAVLEPRFVEPEKQKLIEKIVKLQRALARRAEKIDFQDDHIRQLIKEVQKKAKVIQLYILKQETGTLSSDFMDENKMHLSKKGGIMASVYNSHVKDGLMTLDLSLEINRKLQAVVEDCLLKNITLKESIDTLGREIARLSQENRQLQLKLQSLPSS